ncbi:YIP1 family protein [Spirochaeta isovalerica]|uniref:Yip1 domain-containing protein n=1 Tax=Spirochaeta isovalerica TaxID=150 RepID=A0A841RBC7_9SPIO|nr:YIP1 family protein [Spirochaeta isovalerica]MBB6481006.1 hypothetical protein [Spirochaeta isovalerica]
MKNTFILWKEIIANPFEGYKKLNNDTKLFLPFLTIIILFLFSVLLMIPMQTSDVYGEAMARVQQAALADRGTELSDEQMTAMAEQMKSPMVRNITIVSTIGGGLVSYIVITLVSALILKLLSGGFKKEAVKYSLVLKIILFASIVSMVQALLKMGITLSGDWQRALARVNTTGDLQMALQSPVSLAALFDPVSMGRQVYFLLDYVTDIFNWIYYLFLYAGLKGALALEKNKALAVTVIMAVISIGIALAFTLIG